MCEGCNSGNLTTSQRAMKWRLLHFLSHFAVTFFTLIKAQYPEKLMGKSQCIAANPRVRLLYCIFNAIEVIAFYCSTFLQIYSKTIYVQPQLWLYFIKTHIPGLYFCKILEQWLQIGILLASCFFCLFVWFGFFFLFFLVSTCFWFRLPPEYVTCSAENKQIIPVLLSFSQSVCWLSGSHSEIYCIHQVDVFVLFWSVEYLKNVLKKYVSQYYLASHKRNLVRSQIAAK